MKPSNQQQASFFSVANLLSLSRVPLAMLFAVSWVAPWGGVRYALAVLAIAGLTDALDGAFARRAAARQAGVQLRPTELGAASFSPSGTGSWLDPICDKIFVATVLVSIWFRLHPPLWLLALILAREIAQLPLSVVYVSVPALRKWLRYDFRASFLGKAATVAQFTAIVALLTELTVAPLVARISFLVGMAALIDYLWRAVRMGRARYRSDHADHAHDTGSRPTP